MRAARRFRRAQADDRARGRLRIGHEEVALTAESLPFVPPAPTVHTTDLSVWRLLWKITRSTLSIWPDYAFDKLYIRNRVLGVETIAISDPEGVRHVLTANAGNYRRPYSVTRVARPLVGSGLFLAEGADWRRQRRLLAPTFTPAAIKDRASIHDRPKTIEGRGEAGHWEGDLIICKRTRPVLVLHERKSRVTLAARLTGKSAAETISAMLAVFGRIDPHLRRSITFDNDTAFAQHALLRTMRDRTTSFCDAYASWQKGGIENANGRLRRWLPRHLDIDRTSDQDIQEIVLTTNLTPRKRLGFKTPFQALIAELGKDIQIRFS